MTRTAAAEVAARVATVAAPLACAAYALTHPTSILVGGLAWLAVLAAVMAGFGHLVERLVRTEVDVGLRMAWGAGGFLALAGVGLAAGVLTFPVLAACVAAGYLSFAVHQWRRPRPALLAAVDALPRLTAEPLVTLFFALIATVAVINLLGGVAETQGNPFDDDVAYTPLIKRMLDAGNIDEPFSFRRLSAYGGQTALGGLAALRGTLANLYLVDAGLFQLILLLLVLGLARQRDRVLVTTSSRDGPATDRLLVGFTLLVLVLLPNTATNTGSHWTGVVMFLALYRTATLTARTDESQARMFALLGALAAAACSLRQSFVPVAVVFPLAVLVLRLGRTPRERFVVDRRLWVATIAGGAAVLLPYCIASWRSNHTLMYPLWSGTFNAQVPTQPTLYTGWQEVQWFLKVLLEAEPVRVMLMLAPVLFLAEDRRVGRPLSALTISVVIGFALLIHAFALSESYHLWRYGFGYILPLFIALVIDGGAPGLRRLIGDDPAPVRVPLMGRVVLVACLVVQLAMSGRGMARKYGFIAGDLAAATSGHAPEPLDTELLYAQLQAAVPAGEAIAIALDDPAYLDYARNPIINVDTPGFASYAPGMPFFRGPEPVADYFLANGIRYLAFVRGDQSRYMYRREFWLRRIYFDTELWRVQGAYAVDCLDNFAALAAARTVRFERDGVVLVDLGGGR